MGITSTFPMKIVDGCKLPEKYREILKPGETIKDEDGKERQLPRYFIEILDREAFALQLTKHFQLCEFLLTDLFEASLLHQYPKYIPCGVLYLAHALESFRQECNTVVFVAANGGYRSPAHQRNRTTTSHMWATAANIYRIGNDYVNDKEKIEKYAKIAREAVPGVNVREYGSGVGMADDHLHIDLGYNVYTPLDL